MSNVSCGLLFKSNVLVKYCKLIASDLLCETIKPFTEVNLGFIVKKRRK